MGKLLSFMDLDTWKTGHQLVLQVYKLIRTFPKDERYALSDQMKRAAISITSNIAEGFHRQTFKEKRQFYYMALGSLTELQNQMLIARDIGYVQNDVFLMIAELTLSVRKLTSGLIRSINNKDADS